MIRDNCEQRELPLADIERAFAEECPDGIIDASLFADGIHPNQRGHRIIAETLGRTLVDAGLTD